MTNCNLLDSKFENQTCNIELSFLLTSVHQAAERLLKKAEGFECNLMPTGQYLFILLPIYPVLTKTGEPIGIVKEESA